MARKEQPKPLFSLKEDFKASLDNASNKASLLIASVEYAIEIGAVKESAAAVLKEHCAAFRASLMGEE